MSQKPPATAPSLTSVAIAAALAVACSCTSSKSSDGGACNGAPINAALADEATSIFVSPDGSDIQGDALHSFQQAAR